MEVYKLYNVSGCNSSPFLYFNYVIGNIIRDAQKFFRGVFFILYDITFLGVFISRFLNRT